MGYYLETPNDHDKATYLLSTVAGAQRLDSPYYNAVPFDHVAVCVVDNGLFEAAGVCYDDQEFAAFADPSDSRPKQWITMPRDAAIALNPHLAAILS